MNHRAGSDPGGTLNADVGTDDDVIGQLCFGVNDGGGVDAAHESLN